MTIRVSVCGIAVSSPTRMSFGSNTRKLTSRHVANRVQISSDALSSYVDAVEQAFGADVDYGQAVKFYDAEPIGPGRYAPPRVVSQQKVVMAGSPDRRHISTFKSLTLATVSVFILAIPT